MKPEYDFSKGQADRRDVLRFPALRAAAGAVIPVPTGIHTPLSKVDYVYITRSERHRNSL